MGVLLPVVEPRRRLPRLLLGLVMCGIGIALTVAADLGLAPWSVLDEGLSERTGIPIGTMGIIVGAAVLAMWIPLRERLGLGTILNILVIGITTDLVLLVLETPESGWLQFAYMAVGVFLFGPGSGFYIGAGLGPGPRDGLMTGLARRGIGSIRLVRTGLELAALLAGWRLGGTVGIGTLAFAFTIGPNVQFFLSLSALGEAASPPPTAPSKPPHPAMTCATASD